MNPWIEIPNVIPALHASLFWPIYLLGYLQHVPDCSGDGICTKNFSTTLFRQDSIPYIIHSKKNIGSNFLISIPLYRLSSISSIALA